MTFRIVGIYTAFVLTAGRFARTSFIDGQSDRIMFYEIPDVNNILALTLDIYLVREMKDFLLEEELFSKLIFVYRCPEIMIRFTRMRNFIDCTHNR